MTDPQEILNQQELLAAARMHLHVLVRQATEMGSFVPPYVITKTDDLRAQIGAIKATLRAWNVEVEDLPDDAARPASTAASGASAPGVPGSPTYNIYGLVGSATFGNPHVEKSEVIMGDKFDFSGANISGANVNVKATLTNVTQSIGALNADDATKQALAQLMAQLNAALQQASAQGQEQQAAAVAKRAQALVEEAAAPEPDKAIVESNANALQKAAQNIAASLPLVLEVATKIISYVRPLAGL